MNLSAILHVFIAVIAAIALEQLRFVLHAIRRFHTELLSFISANSSVIDRCV